MNKLIENISDINDLILQGKGLEAFEMYYDNEVELQENDNLPYIGKDVNRKRKEDFYAAITEFRCAQPLKITVGENITMVEWHLDYTHKDWGVKNYNQIAVQEWQHGKIIKERFYYGS